MAQHDDKKQLKPYQKALVTLQAHALLGPVAQELHFYEASKYGKNPQAWAKDNYCQVFAHATVVYNEAAKLSESDWLGVFSITALALALDATRLLPVPDPLSDLAAQIAAHHWWRSMKLGTLPESFVIPEETALLGRLPLAEIAQRLQLDPQLHLSDRPWRLNGSSTAPWLHPAPKQNTMLHSWNPAASQTVAQRFVQALVESAKRTLLAQHDPSVLSGNPLTNLSNSNAAKARRWLIAHYPLLGSLITQFDLIEDADVCKRLNISIAAIHVRLGEIYINPNRGLSFENAKFVLAHEVLHAGLSHSRRRQGREPMLWNVACDFVINDWLVSMGVGIAPDAGLLFDDELRGWAAEDIYLRLASDLRIRRRLQTLRGDEVDMLDEGLAGGFTDKEDFYRHALMQGLDYHQASGRGLLPAGLVEAIRVLNQPPIAWQAHLADWLREYFPLPLRLRTYARPSRRQSVTPDIARPRFYEPEQERTTRTFGVVIDTSASMSREHLGMAIGAVVSYSLAQNVKAVRLIYCDARPYDEGYVDIENLASRVQVKGRGGTQLQPAISLLEGQRDFPKDAPILIITDGFIEDQLSVVRDHAFLLAPGRRLPFVTRKPVFQMD